MTYKKVQVWIYFKDSKAGSYNFLLLQTTPQRGGFWQPVTGSVEPGETLERAALREAVEETGLAIHGAPRALNASFEYIDQTHPERKGATILETGFALDLGVLSGGGAATCEG